MNHLKETIRECVELNPARLSPEQLEREVDIVYCFCRFFDTTLKGIAKNIENPFVNEHMYYFSDNLGGYVVDCLVESLKEGVRLGAEIIDTHKALNKFYEFKAEVSRYL